MQYILNNCIAYSGQDVGKTDAYGNSALLLAAERGHRHLIQLLIGQAHTKFIQYRKIDNEKPDNTMCLSFKISLFLS